jgi:hypothetical protein
MTPADAYCDSECIAFLLDVEDVNAGHVMTYQHVGQHGEASIEFYENCTPAAEKQYIDLQMELLDIGYDVKVCKRWNRK